MPRAGSPNTAGITRSRYSLPNAGKAMARSAPKPNTHSAVKSMSRVKPKSFGKARIKSMFSL